MRLRFAVACCVLGVFAACAGDEGSPVVEPPTEAPRPGTRGTECTDLTSGDEVVIEMEDFRFEPSCVEMTPSQDLTNTNNGSVTHNFSVDGFPGIDVDTEPGQTNRYEPLGPGPGDYTFFCKYHREQGMEGELVVVEG